MGNLATWLRFAVRLLVLCEAISANHFMIIILKLNFSYDLLISQYRFVVTVQ